MEHKSKLTRDTAATQPPLTDTERGAGESRKEERGKNGGREVKMTERMEGEEEQNGEKMGGDRREETENC